jgi:hypothetical protein
LVPFQVSRAHYEILRKYRDLVGLETLIYLHLIQSPQFQLVESEVSRDRIRRISLFLDLWFGPLGTADGLLGLGTLRDLELADDRIMRILG